MSHLRKPVYNMVTESRGHSIGCVLQVHGRALEISSGTDDSVTVFSNSDRIYVYSENNRLDYCGMEVFDRNDGERIGDVFFQSGDMEADIGWCIGLSQKGRAVRFLEQYIEG